MTTPLSNFVPVRKADLHAHLNGCIPTDVVRELLQEFSVPIPDGFNPATDLQITSPVGSLAEYFRPWYLLKLLPVGRPCLEKMVSSALVALKSDGIDYVELRNSPFSIAKQNDISLEHSLNWLADALAVATSQTGVEARLVLGLSRFDCTLDHGRKLLDAIKATSCRHLIVGVDLSGDEDIPVDGEIVKFFREAKEEMGLGISIHAGETFIASNVEWAVSECRADRIGHGLAAASTPRLLELLASSDVCIEVCLSSNLLTGRVASIMEHPVNQFIATGVPFVLCTDNPSIHNVPLSGEYALFAEHFPTSTLLDSMYENQLRYSFGQHR